LVEPSPRALMTVAAYIDLNPVRAGLVEDPGLYRWSGYGEALAGESRSRSGLGLVVGEEAERWESSARRYRCFLFGVGSGGEAGQKKIDGARALAVIEAGGEVTLAEALRCRVRYFSDGVVLGAEGFVRAWAKPRGLRRDRDEPRPMAGTDWGGLAVLGRLRRAVYH
jgi:putative transposase